MANKTYFKGNNKKRKNTKKYLFAGFDESMQIDNTGYLNALYNPNYYDAPTVSNETIQKNIDQTLNTSRQSSADYALAKQANDQSLLNLTAIKKEAEEAEKASMQQMAEKAEQEYTAKNLGAITGLTTPAVKYGLDLAAKKAAEKTAQEVTKVGATQIAKSAGNIKAGQTVGQAALSGTNLLYSGLGAAGVVGGEAWKYFSDDKNPYTYKPSEAAGTIGGNTLSWAGTGAGIGTAIMPGLGTLIGAGAGALGGLTVGLIQNRKKKKMAASLESERSQQEADWNEQKAKYDKYLEQGQRVYNYNQNLARTGMSTLAEQARQNRLMQLTEGQLAGNTNIAMTGGGRKYFGKGGAKVPGGKVVPIGQGAVEFVGRSHAKGGIMLDSQTEVEGGETMDKVRMKNGKMNDYFFSKFLKYKGKSFAQHHKELIKRGASQKEIQALAKKQEAMANRKGEKDRSPNQVAKYGGLRKYQTAGFEITPANLPWIGDKGQLLSEKEQNVKKDLELDKEFGIGPIVKKAAAIGLNSIIEEPTDTILKITDPRKTRLTTGKPINPNVDLMTKEYPTMNLKNIISSARNRGLSKEDALTLAAMDLQETQWGITDDYTGHTLYGSSDKSPVENFIDAFIKSKETADRLKLKDEYTRLQVYNGLGMITPDTEKNYHGFRMKKIYGVEIPKSGINMRENPLYGKQIVDLRDNILKQNPEFLKLVDTYYTKKTGGLRKYFTGGIRKYKTAGAVDDPIDPLIMTAIVRLGINDTDLSNYKKERTNDGVKIKHIKTGKEIFFNNNEIKDLTSSKNTYGPGEVTLRSATEEEMKQMQSDTNPSFFDYAKGVYNVITNPLDAIQYTNTRGNIMDDPANWLRMVEMDQQNNPNPVNELLELAPSVMSMGAAGPKYTVTMAPKAPNFGLGTGSAIPKSSLSRAYDLARPTFTRSPIMVPRVTAKQPAGTTVTTAAQRESARNASGSTALGNRFYDNKFYGRRDFWEQNLPPEVTVSGTASRKINIPSYNFKSPLAGFAGGYIGPFGEDFINYTTNPEYIGQYGTILNTGNNRNTGNTGNTGSTDNTEEYYKTEEERKAAEKLRQKVANWASGYSGSTGGGGTGTSAGYTQSATSTTPPFTGSLALGTGNSNSTRVQNPKTNDKKALNMPEDKKEAIPFNRDLANRLALLQIGAGLPSIIPPLIALGKDIPTPNWDPFTYNRIPSVGGAPAITAGSVAAPRLSRVDYSDKMTKADEMALAAMNKSAEAGPQSGILNMAILGKNYRQILELQKQETDENKKQSDIEKQLAAKVSEGNRDAAMLAASKNAENILKTNDINSAINQANLGAELKRYEYISQKNDLEYRKNIEKYLTDLSALETLAGIPMQMASDTAKTYSDQYLAYLASDPTSGVYDRYINAMLGREDKKKTGGIKKYTSRLGDLVKNPKLKSKII